MARQLRAFAVTVLALAALGVPAGLVWSALSPRPPYRITEGTASVLADPATQTLIAADGWFATVTGGLGLACGALAWFLSRHQQLAVLLGLCGGSVLASFVTLWTGTTFTFGVIAVEASAEPGVTFVAGPLALTADGVLVSWPLLAVGLFGLLEGMHGYRESPLRTPYGIGSHPPAVDPYRIGDPPPRGD